LEKGRITQTKKDALRPHRLYFVFLFEFSRRNWHVVPRFRLTAAARSRYSSVSYVPKYSSPVAQLYVMSPLLVASAPLTLALLGCAEPWSMSRTPLESPQM
jgi:hypothetical protein